MKHGLNIEVVKRNGKSIIEVKMEYDREVADWLYQNLMGVNWNRYKKAFELTDTNSNREKLGLPVLLVGREMMSKIHPNNHEQIKRLVEHLQLKSYSTSTIRTYRNEFAQWLYRLNDELVENATPEQIRTYILFCINTLNLSDNQIHSRINALKFYYEQVLGNPKLFIEIPRPKKAKSLPKVLSKFEIKRIFKVVGNLKHRMILKLVYGLGMRVGEIVELKVTDVDSKRMMVHIKNAKGKKDRYVPLPYSILEELRVYYVEYKPNKYLFEGQNSPKMAVRTVQAIFKNAMHDAGVHRNVGIHALRHSYATHLLESGTDMHFIQKLLGHQQIKTTEIYAQVTNTFLRKISSPLDSMDD